MTQAVRGLKTPAANREPPSFPRLSFDGVSVLCRLELGVFPGRITTHAKPQSPSDATIWEEREGETVRLCLCRVPDTCGLSWTFLVSHHLPDRRAKRLGGS